MRCERLLPVEGGIDLAGMFNAMQAGLPISIEIPHEVRKPALGIEEWSRQAMAASKTAFAPLRGRK